MLTGVTITGADDGVEPGALAELSAEFPFVEWGILFSHKRMGDQRYPSTVWLRKLREMSPCSRTDFVLSFHVCGTMAREAVAEAHLAWPIRHLDGTFYRLQMNGYEPGCVNDTVHALRHKTHRMILQCRAEADLQLIASDAVALRADVLFDPSGGRGLEPFAWPSAPLGCRMGYAGGITPENVVQVIADIVAAHGGAAPDFWIDMESGVRTDDRFDLVKVRRVLEACAPLVSVA